MDKDEEILKEFADSIDVEFNDLSLLQRALTHRSFLNEVDDPTIKHNERLEFLGDAVLELIITEYLFGKYPDRKEGELTSFRAALVKTESLAETSEKLNVGKYLYISKGEDLTGGRTKPYILANTYESVLGSIYLDQGYDISKKFVYSTLIPKIDTIVKYRLDIDSKSKLQEISQEVTGVTPTYELESENGPDHNKDFTMKVVIGKKEFGRGVGKSKQIAEQQAAQEALKNWDKLIASKVKKNKK